MDRIGALRAVLETNPADPFARYGLAMALSAAGQNDQALAEYDTILAHNPDYVPAYQMSAQLLLKLDRREEARTRLSDGIRIAGESGNAHAASEMQAMADDLAA